MAAGKLTYWGRWFWPWAMTSVKIGVSVMLLRFHQKKFWRRFIYFVIVLQCALTIYTMIFYSIECRPAKAYWLLRDAKYKGKCIAHNIRLTSVGAVAGVNIFTDFILSLAPIPILMRIRRPLFERIAVGFLMSMGLTATAASMTKTIQTFARQTNDINFNTQQLRMWALIEEDLVFIAACIPTLKAPAHRLLAYLRLVPPPPGSGEPSYDGGKGSSGIRTIGSASMKRSIPSYLSDEPSRDVVKLKSLQREETFSSSEEEILGLAEVRRTGEIWRTEEFQVGEETVDLK